MKVGELIEKRQSSWDDLERLCGDMAIRKGRKDPVMVARFSALYRAACADLALAEAYQLPPNTVDYLHRLVARAHNQMYRSHRFNVRRWYEVIFENTPQLIFNDRCVHICFYLFWGLFLASGFLAYQNQTWPGFAEQVIGEQQMEQFSDMYGNFGGRGFGVNSEMLGFYILNNAGIGLQCFVHMLLVLPGMVTLSYNAVYLGSVFGYMFRPEHGEAGMNFKNFVTAHGPFELTAIILSAGAGLKIGLSWMITNGLNRADSLVKNARDALPIAMTAVMLFIMAAMIEGFISPTSSLYMPWWVKGAVAVICSLVLMIYFVVLGYPRVDTVTLDSLRTIERESEFRGGGH